MKIIIGLGWVAFFVFAFFRWGPTFSLPGDIEVTRMQIVTSEYDKNLLFPQLLNQLLDRVLGSDLKTEGWQFFQWRLVFYAALLTLGMIAFGRLLLRLIRFDRSGGLERLVFGYGLGVSAMTLLVLTFGLGGVLNATVFIGVLVGATVVEVICSLVFRSNGPSVKAPRTPRGTIAFCLMLVAPMLLMMLLGSMSPPTDFDVREYHLQGPKEYFQNGHIGFLPHNAYTSFPFLTEMLSLLGMVVRGDWYTGALLGKVLLATFAPMTALALIAAGRRCFDAQAGWLAAMVLLTTPWIYRISIIAYAEGGLAFFLFASLLAVARWNQERNVSNAMLMGLICGSSMACKYPALLSAIAPCGLVILYLGGRGSRRAAAPEGTDNESAQQELRPPETGRTTAKTVCVFAAGIAIAVGPWLLKNLIETGNPVYPLGYSVFGGTDWTPEINARWKAGHSPPNHKISDLASRAADVSIRSYWMSPLLFGFAPLALLLPRWRKHASGFWLYVLWMFGTWWIFTHRIDRFWVPMIPVIALLAGAGLSSVWRGGLKYVLGVLVGLLVVFNTVFCSVPRWAGYNAWLTEPARAREEIDQRFAVMLLRAEAYNDRVASPGRVLCVGEAAVFEARSNVIYNTVFDLNLFQEICAERVTGGPDSDVELRPIEEVRSRLQERDVRFIVTNWQEVLRYRAPGSYGFSDFVRPEHFDKLVEAGVLRRLDTVKTQWNELSEHDQQQVAAWGTPAGSEFRVQEIFEVIQTE